MQRDYIWLHRLNAPNLLYVKFQVFLCNGFSLQAGNRDAKQQNVAGNILHTLKSCRFYVCNVLLLIT